MTQFVVGEQFNGKRDQKGYVFKVLDRNGDVCLLEKSNPNHSSGTKFYEVVILRRVPETQFPNGDLVPAHLAMPSPEEWGVYGWSPYDYESSLNKFNQISQNL